MAKKTTGDLIKILATKYFPGVYKPETQFISELNLLHSTEVVGIGGEQALNDATTDTLVGVSDFKGTQAPTDSNGLLRAITIEYGQNAASVSPALVAYSELKKDFPTWLLNSEVILKSRGNEAFRIRASELTLGNLSEKVASDWAKELERTIKIESSQDLQLFLSTPKGAVMDGAKKHYVRVNLYGVKFGDRKVA